MPFPINVDPARVPALVAALPDAMRTDMALLNPKAYDLSRLEAKLILNGRDDQIIPYSESVALEAAAPEGRGGHRGREPGPWI